MESALVARLGTVVFAVALGLPAVLSSATARASVVVASIETSPPGIVAPLVIDTLPAVELEAQRPPIVVVLAASTVDEPAGEAVEEPAPVVVLGASGPPPAPAAPPAPAPAFPPPEPLVADGVVTASWYGPGFYGNRTACGQEYTPEIVGVAHRTLPCGTRIRITSPAGSTVVVPVIDRGPFIAGRHLDLSNATRAALSCSDLCTVRMTVLD